MAGEAPAGDGVRAPGTLRGDCGVYAGTRLLGHMRGKKPTILAFRPDGSVLGTFPSRKAAMGAISALSVSGAEGKP